MEFETLADHDPGAPVQDVAQEAVDATATTYTRSPDTDVEEQLRAELRSRGLRAVSEDTIAQIATQIRSGHATQVGRHDGSVDRRP